MTMAAAKPLPRGSGVPGKDRLLMRVAQGTALRPMLILSSGQSPIPPSETFFNGLLDSHRRSSGNQPDGFAERSPRFCR